MDRGGRFTGREDRHTPPSPRKSASCSVDTPVPQPERPAFNSRGQSESSSRRSAAAGAAPGMALQSSVRTLKECNLRATRDHFKKGGFSAGCHGQRSGGSAQRSRPWRERRLRESWRGFHRRRLLVRSAPASPPRPTALEDSLRWPWHPAEELPKKQVPHTMPTHLGGTDLQSVSTGISEQPVGQAFSLPVACIFAVKHGGANAPQTPACRAGGIDSRPRATDPAPPESVRPSRVRTAHPLIPR